MFECDRHGRGDPYSAGNRRSCMHAGPLAAAGCTADLDASAEPGVEAVLEEEAPSVPPLPHPTPDVYTAASAPQPGKLSTSELQDAAEPQPPAEGSLRPACPSPSLSASPAAVVAVGLGQPPNADSKRTARTSPHAYSAGKATAVALADTYEQTRGKGRAGALPHSAVQRRARPDGAVKPSVRARAAAAPGPKASPARKQVTRSSSTVAALKSLDATLSGLQPSMLRCADRSSTQLHDSVRDERAATDAPSDDGGETAGPSRRRGDDVAGDADEALRRLRRAGARDAGSAWQAGKIPPLNWAARGVPRRVNATVKLTRSMRGPVAEELVRAAARVEGEALRQGSLGEPLAPVLSELSAEQLLSLCLSSSMSAIPTVWEAAAAGPRPPALAASASACEPLLRTFTGWNDPPAPALGAGWEYSVDTLPPVAEEEEGDLELGGDGRETDEGGVDAYA